LESQYGNNYRIYSNDKAVISSNVFYHHLDYLVSQEAAAAGRFGGQVPFSARQLSGEGAPDWRREVG
jgi:hypothetical protein